MPPIDVLRFESTPNPNAVKCILDREVSADSEPFASAGAARGHALASALFELEGVTNLLLCRDWLTVVKSPDAPWPPIKRGVKRVLAERG